MSTPRRSLTGLEADTNLLSGAALMSLRTTQTKGAKLIVDEAARRAGPRHLRLTIERI